MRNIANFWTLFLIITSSNIFAQAPNAAFTFSNACELSPVSFSNQSTSSSSIIKRYLWDFGTGLMQDSSNVKDPTFTYEESGSYWIKLKVWNEDGFEDSISKNIIIHPKPVAIVDLTVPCYPSEIVMTDNSTLKSGLITYRQWNIEGNISNLNPYTYSPSVPGDYKVVLTIASNKECWATYSDTLKYTFKPTIKFTPNSPAILCEGSEIQLKVSGANTYYWDNGSTKTERLINQPGYYNVTGQTGNQCSTKDSILIEEKPNPVADAGRDQKINIGASITLMGRGGTTYTWSPSKDLSDSGIANPIATPQQSTTYYLTVKNDFGCTDYDSMKIYVETGKVKVHNFITPNNDGANDVWDLSGVAHIDSAHVFVFNRWGWEVFRSEEYQHDWDGTFKGEPLPDGTYIYLIKFKDENIEVLKGSLQIIRN
jgi:gliding motility-associated-like protein